MVDGALHPVDFLEVHAIFVLQETANENRRRHGVKRHADALALEILRLLYPGLLVNGNEAVAECARGKNRDRDEGALLVGEALDEFRARIFRDIEFPATRHAVENRS